MLQCSDINISSTDSSIASINFPFVHLINLQHSLKVAGAGVGGHIFSLPLILVKQDFLLLQQESWHHFSVVDFFLSCLVLGQGDSESV